MGPISSGIAALDNVLDGLRFGDNVVFQVEKLADYRYFTEPFGQAAIAGGGIARVTPPAS